MIKKTTFMKIIFYTGIFIWLLQASATAQIISTDVTDSTITKSSAQNGTLSYTIDLDNNGVKDFIIAVKALNNIPSGCTMTPAFQTELSSWIGTMPSASNPVATSSGYTALIDSDSTIDATSHIWSVAQQNFLYEKIYAYPSCVWDSTIDGTWMNDTTAFIGLKIKIGADIHYGYVHVRFDQGIDTANNSFISVTILDYAYNSAPDQPILAGEGIINAVGHSVNSIIQTVAYFNTLTNELQINNNSNDKITVSIFQIDGKMIKTIDSKEQLSFIDMSDIPGGIYLYSISGQKILASGRFVRD
jgi:hypothetical protein